MSTTTLVEELEQAAERTDQCATWNRYHGNIIEAKEYEAEAARLRARAAHVQRMLEAPMPVNASAAHALRALTGPDIGQPREGGEK